MDFESTYTIHINAEQCRTILRLDLPYNFSGVVKSEINENYFQFKNLAVNTRSIFYPNLPQVVSIRLSENAEGSTNIIINSSPYADVEDSKIVVWQNSLEQLVNIVWTDIYRAAQNRYSNSLYTNSHSTSEASQIYKTGSQNNNIQNITTQSVPMTNRDNRSQRQFAPNRKWIGIIVVVAIVIVLITIFISDGGTANIVNKESRAISCAKSAIMDTLRDPSSMSVNDSRILEKDNYDRYIVYLDITATNGFGGRVRNIYYVCVRLGSGDTYYINRLLPYVDSSSLIDALKGVNNWGKAPNE